MLGGCGVVAALLGPTGQLYQCLFQHLFHGVNRHKMNGFFDDIINFGKVRFIGGRDNDGLDAVL